MLAIVANRSQSGKFVYELPDNVAEVYEAYLEDLDWGHKPKSGKRTQLNKKEYQALRSILLDEDVDWETVFVMFQKKRFSVDDLLMGADFLRIVQECYRKRYPMIVFSDFLWTMRSIYMPLFLILQTTLPKADIYHCVATGYAGVLGSMAKYFYRSGLLISEHGIYTREREEELLKANWVEGIYKNVWIDQFRKMSRLAYDRADMVTCLYERARQLQLGLGCEEAKTMVTPNGIDMSRFADLPGKQPEDEGFINIGAVLRVTPIKDVKTMIRAFAFAKEQNPALKLWIMGPVDEDKEYAEECFQLVEAMRVKDVIFTGRINVTEYLGRMDFTILTSISEGQPLTILESYAAKKPVIATDVGDCRGLIYGDGDNAGTAGILTHIMNVEEITAAIRELARSEEQRKTMGENGYARAKQRYQLCQMIETYEQLYTRIGWEYGKLWPEAATGDGYGTEELSGEGYGAEISAEEEQAAGALEAEEYASGVSETKKEQDANVPEAEIEQAAGALEVKEQTASVSEAKRKKPVDARKAEKTFGRSLGSTKGTARSDDFDIEDFDLEDYGRAGELADAYDIEDLDARDYDIEDADAEEYETVLSGGGAGGIRDVAVEDLDEG